MTPRRLLLSVIASLVMAFLWFALWTEAEDYRWADLCDGGEW